MIVVYFIGLVGHPVIFILLALLIFIQDFLVSLFIIDIVSMIYLFGFSAIFTMRYNRAASKAKLPVLTGETHFVLDNPSYI